MPSVVLNDNSKVTAEEFSEILAVLQAIYRLMIDASLTLTDTVVAVVASVGDSKLDSKRRARLTDRLQELLGARRLVAWLAGFESLHDNECNFYSARVTTDIRPIMQEGEEQSVGAAVPIHTLRIDYLDRRINRRSSMFVALDQSDIEELIAELVKAQNVLGVVQSGFLSSGIELYKARSGRDQ